MISKNNIYLIEEGGEETTIIKAINGLNNMSDFLLDITPAINKFTGCEIRSLILRQDIAAKIPDWFLRHIGGNPNQPALECLVNAVTNNNKKITMFMSIQEPSPPKKKKKTFFDILKKIFK